MCPTSEQLHFPKEPFAPNILFEAAEGNDIYFIQSPFLLKWYITDQLGSKRHKLFLSISSTKIKLWFTCGSEKEPLMEFESRQRHCWRSTQIEINPF